MRYEGMDEKKATFKRQLAQRTNAKLMPATFNNAKAFAQGNEQQTELVDSFIRASEQGAPPFSMIDSKILGCEDALNEMETVGLFSKDQDSGRCLLVSDEQFSANLAVSNTLPGGIDIKESWFDGYRFNAAEYAISFSQLKAYARCPDTPLVNRTLCYEYYEDEVSPVQCPFCLESIHVMHRAQIITKPFHPPCSHLLFFTSGAKTSVFESEQLQRFLQQPNPEVPPFLPGNLLELAAMSDNLSRRYGMLNWPGSVAYEIHPSVDTHGFSAFIAIGSIGFAADNEPIYKKSTGLINKDQMAG